LRAAIRRCRAGNRWRLVDISGSEWNYLERAHRFVEEDDPEIPGYDDALWPIERDYRGQDPREVFDDFADLRQEHVEFLLALPPEAWERTGDHSLYGKISLWWMENHVCDHDSEHLDQAREVLAG
jgi:hypothetical protein